MFVCRDCNANFIRVIVRIFVFVHDNNQEKNIEYQHKSFQMFTYYLYVLPTTSWHNLWG